MKQACTNGCGRKAWQGRGLCCHECLQNQGKGHTHWCDKRNKERGQ